jgi:hypothetical protein
VLASIVAALISSDTSIELAAKRSPLDVDIAKAAIATYSGWRYRLRHHITNDPLASVSVGQRDQH